MKFFVVTPSFNQLPFLKRCVASVRDQASEAMEQGAGSIAVHHHVQDGGSTDGTGEWLERYMQEVGGQGPEDGDLNTENLTLNTALSGYTFSYESTPDNGMYDAINRGWGLAGADVDVVAHLNCDEQYLPDALKTIADYFSNHRKADVVLADMIVVDNGGAYICHRRSLKPHSLLSRICCVGMTTTTFQRTSVVRDKKVMFDTSWRNIGDMVWYNALHKAGVRFTVCNELVSAFTDTGVNLNLTEEALRERKRYAEEYLGGTYFLTRLVSKFYSLKRFLKEFYLKPPADYAMYWNDLSEREVRLIDKPTGLWHRKGPAQQI